MAVPVLLHRFTESAVNPQKRRRETMLEDRGSRVCSAHTVRTAALRTACTTWEIMCTWSLRSRTCSHTSSTSSVCGRTTLVGQTIDLLRLE